MTQTEVKRSSSAAADQSIGDLVSVAAKDVSQLLRYEIELAKSELKQDVRRLAIGGALLIVAGFVACLVLFLLCFAFAYGLAAIGAPGGLWGGFLWAALTCVLLAAIAVLVGITLVRKMGGMSKTRRTLSGDMSLLRLHRHAANGAADGAATSAATGPGGDPRNPRGSD